MGTRARRSRAKLYTGKSGGKGGREEKGEEGKGKKRKRKGKKGKREKKRDRGKEKHAFYSIYIAILFQFTPVEFQFTRLDSIYMVSF